MELNVFAGVSEGRSVQGAKGQCVRDDACEQHEPRTEEECFPTLLRYDVMVSSSGGK